MEDSNNKLSAKSAAVIITCALLFCVSLISAGCGSSSGTPLSDQSAQSVLVKASQNMSTPCIFSVFDDKSRSVKSARIAPIQEQDLLALINILRQTGGELSFGLIGESRDRPLLRLRIPVPPPLPAKHESQNAFERAELDSAFQGQAALDLRIAYKLTGETISLKSWADSSFLVYYPPSEATTSGARAAPKRFARQESVPLSTKS
ncbi:MAG TPA: hypothetical protein VF791_06220 [Pyrinomonadaceae bacterium]